jgi:hypothetical protein
MAQRLAERLGAGREVGKRQFRRGARAVALDREVLDASNRRRDLDTEQTLVEVPERFAVQRG